MNFEEMKLLCTCCGDPAQINAHGSQFVKIGEAVVRVTDLSLECKSCVGPVGQGVRLTDITDEQILTHPRWYENVGA